MQNMPNFGPPRHTGPPPRFGGGFRGPGPGNFMPMGPPPPHGIGRPPFPGPFDDGFAPPMNRPPRLLGPDLNGPPGPGPVSC